LVILHAAVPVGAEAENVFVKVLCGSAIVDDETGVDDSRFGRRSYEYKAMVLRVIEVKARVVCAFAEFAWRQAFAQKKSPEFLYIIRAKSDLS
jgi:hypothetical protein